jgi:putative restriction endonuclease
VQGYVAVTHQDWFHNLAQRVIWEEVNFWRPSAYHSFNGPPGSPFFFKLKAPINAIGGFGLVARFSRLPDWLAWECFGEANGAASFDEMEQRLNDIRTRNNFLKIGPISQIGCILLSTVVFFPPDMWIPQPSDWSPRNLTYQRYDLEEGEGLRVWLECRERLETLRAQISTFPISSVLKTAIDDIAPEATDRFGAPRLVRPRLGQGTFRVAVTDAYGRACAVTGEHSLPVLEAAHIRPYGLTGPHDICNGLLLRADLHRLFDLGYLTVTPNHVLRVSEKLKADYDNGRTYYPLEGPLRNLPAEVNERPSEEFLRWHNENRYRG